AAGNPGGDRELLIAALAGPALTGRDDVAALPHFVGRELPFTVLHDAAPLVGPDRLFVAEAVDADDRQPRGRRDELGGSPLAEPRVGQLLVLRDAGCRDDASLRGHVDVAPFALLRDRILPRAAEDEAMEPLLLFELLQVGGEAPVVFLEHL